MGWSMQIYDPDGEIWDCELEEIVRELPDVWRKFIPKGETMEQPYGFPAYGNISHATKDGVEVSGSYITTTESSVEEFLLHLVKELKVYGHPNLKLRNNRETDLFHLENLISRIEEQLEQNLDDNSQKINSEVSL